MAPDTSMSAAPAPAVVREHPLPFTGESVRGILAGRKTQTRRVVKWWQVDPGLNLSFSGLEAWKDARGWILYSGGGNGWHERSAPTPCPYGDPFDRLWVRETWSMADPCLLGGRPQPVTFYRADNNRPTWAEAHWRSGRFMPRTRSRITLELTAVRVERLQAVTDEDLLLEGMGLHDGTNGPAVRRALYRDTWDTLNALRGYPWIANPFVWVLDFRRLA